MELLLQNVVVGLIVAGCVVLSAWRLMSFKLRLKTLDVVGPVTYRYPPGPMAK